MQPLMNVIGNLSYVAVCVLGSILAIQGIIDIGVIVSFILYVRLFTSPQVDPDRQPLRRIPGGKWRDL